MALLPFFRAAVGKSSLWIPYTTYFLFRFAYFLLEVPTMRMMEHAICHQQLDAMHARPGVASMLADLDEAACKTPSVQEQLSSLTGWRYSSYAIPGLLSAVYFGAVADRRGHRPVLAICCVGWLLSTLWILMICYFYNTFSTTLILASSLFLFIGGGPPVYAAISSSLIAELAPAASRTRYLFLYSAMPHCAKLMTPPVAAWLMAQNLYLASIVSCVLVILCILLLQTLTNPPRFAKVKAIDLSASSDSLLNNAEPISSNAGPNFPGTHHVSGASTDNSYDVMDDDQPELMRQPDVPAVEEFIPHLLDRFNAAAALMLRKPVLGFCYVAFFLKGNAMSSELFAFQYLSEKFNWPFRETTILRFALSSGAVLTTLFICPLTSSALARRGVPTVTIDFSIAHVSLLCMSACFMVAWRATSGAVFVLSMLGAGFCEGLEPTLLSLLSAQSHVAETGSLFAMGYTYNLLGDVTGAPLMSALMSIGREQHGSSDGYCFLAASLLFGVMSVLLCMIGRGRDRRNRVR